MFDQIPVERPKTPLLDTIDSPRDLRSLDEGQLDELAHELRHFLLYTVGRTGGHFGAGLGVVELTIALHYVFDTPVDRLVWDVGHQTYPHKILTGRREAMATLRAPDGLAPFPSIAESEFDTFGTGHSSTSISAALGMELAARLNGESSNTVVVIGDGAMTAGMAFEALNHVAASHADILIVLNDNAMSISENVGGLANYFARNISAYRQSNDTDVAAGSPGSLFKDLGFNYSGPIDGHDLALLTGTLKALKDQKGPRILHALTRKGKGYAPAEQSPATSHSLTKLEKKDNSGGPTYASVFGQWICGRAGTDSKLVAITPAMKDGSGLVNFEAQFPDRFHDVAIAEQHAVTLAAGLAAGGAKPVVAIYSTFLQRAYDQLIHDIAIQNLDVTFAVDRAGLLEDGPTHSGVFDLAFTRTIPNLIVTAPSNDVMATRLLDFAYDFPGPVLVRYPRGAAAVSTQEEPVVELGRAHVIRQGSRVAILSFGSMRAAAEDVARQNDFTLVDMRFVKPLDGGCIDAMAYGHELLVTVEEHVVAGGAGSAVNEYLANRALTVPVLNLGIADVFVDQDEPAAMQSGAGLTAAGIDSAINRRLAK